MLAKITVDKITKEVNSEVFVKDLTKIMRKKGNIVIAVWKYYSTILCHNELFIGKLDDKNDMSFAFKLFTSEDFKTFAEANDDIINIEEDSDFIKIEIG